MIFTEQEIGAIWQLASAMAIIDGDIDISEKKVIAVELFYHYGQKYDIDSIISRTDLMTPSEACPIVSNMSLEKKEFVSAFLGAIILADGKIEKSEINLWVQITLLCGLPQMDLKEAVNYFKF